MSSDSSKSTDEKTRADLPDDNDNNNKPSSASSPSTTPSNSSLNNNTKLGRNVSGRPWKMARQFKRASSLRISKSNNTSSSWRKKQQLKRHREEVVAMQQELLEERRQAKLLKRERRLENEKRKMENEYRAAQQSAQALNSHKLKSTLKAMSKKQLRQIKKTRVNSKTGAVEYVSAYAK